MMSMIGSLPIDTRFEHREGVLYGEGGFTSVDEEFAHGVEASGDGTIDFDVHVTIFLGFNWFTFQRFQTPQRGWFQEFMEAQ